MPSLNLMMIGGAVVLVLTVIAVVYRAGMKRAEGKAAKEKNDAYERHLEDISRANRARPGRLSDDPYNRDKE